MVHVTSGWRPKIEGEFEREVKWILNNALTSSEFFTLSETAKYRPSEDEGIWRQNRGEREEYVEVYYKGDWLCDVHSKMTRDQIVNKVYKVLQLKFLARREKEREQNANSNNTTAK
jgi:hypothetical protein